MVIEIYEQELGVKIEPLLKAGDKKEVYEYFETHNGPMRTPEGIGIFAKACAVAKKNGRMPPFDDDQKKFRYIWRNRWELSEERPKDGAS